MLFSPVRSGHGPDAVDDGGEVVEHECGYRAQFAKVRSLDSALGPCDMVALRVAYGVG